MDSLFRDLWQIWTTDGLRSIGMLMIPTCAILCLRSWANFQSPAKGEWWALGLCALAMVLARVVAIDPISFHLNVESSVRLIPTGLIVWMYVTGVILFFFGREAYSRAWIPVAFLLFLNPLPVFFQRLVDLPLQYFAASMARSLAQFLGTTLDPDRLKLMFSPALGMFVAPGCDGLRGAVAMGYLTLTIGCVRHLPGRLLVLFVSAGILFAYLCNLFRLCLLVVCYKVALVVPLLADHMVAADYAIGGIIFLCATLLLVKWPVGFPYREAR
jgi:exosortase J